jgi:hypothetical protein
MAFYGTEISFVMFMSAHCWSLYSPLMDPVHTIPSNFITIHFNIVLQAKPGPYKQSLSVRFPYDNFVCIPPVPCMPHSSPISYFIFSCTKNGSKMNIHRLKVSCIWNVVTAVLCKRNLPYGNVWACVCQVLSQTVERHDLLGQCTVDHISLLCSVSDNDVISFWNTLNQNDRKLYVTLNSVTL